MNRLYFLAVEPQVIQSVLDDMLGRIWGEKKERLLRYRFDIDRKIGVFAEVLLRCLICLETGLKYRDIEIETGGTGKPFLKNFSGLEFNVSHTRNAVAAALSSAPVGVDIEKIRAIDISVAEKIFSDNELAWLREGAEEQNRRFFDIWTKKEAFVKRDGRGLNSGLRSVDVTDRRIRGELTTVTAGDYIISLCSGVKSDRDDFLKITEPELLEMWRSFSG